jgi:hypothetical protein
MQIMQRRSAEWLFTAELLARRDRLRVWEFPVFAGDACPRCRILENQVSILPNYFVAEVARLRKIHEKARILANPATKGPGLLSKFGTTDC